MHIKHEYANCISHAYIGGVKFTVPNGNSLANNGTHQFARSSHIHFTNIGREHSLTIRLHFSGNRKAFNKE